MNPQIRSPLDAEEHDLAERLAKSPTGQPTAELDARILAAARAAVPARRPGAHWRWGFGASAAAMLAVAVFLPLYTSEQKTPGLDFEEAEPAAQAPSRKADRDDAGSEPAKSSLGEIVAPVPAPFAPAEAPVLHESRPQRRDDGAGMREEAVAADAQAPVATKPAAFPASAAPSSESGRSAPAEKRARAAAIDYDQANVDKGALIDRSAEPLPAPAASAPTGATRQAVTGASAGLAAPASAPALSAEQAQALPAHATPMQLDDEFAHIRGLLASDRELDARDALAELLRRYPDAVVPTDLRALLGEVP